MLTVPPQWPGMDRRHPSANGTVASWLINEKVGSAVHDYSGRGEHGSLQSMDPATDWVVDGEKVSLDFDGFDDYVSTPFSFAGMKQFTMSVLCRRRTAGDLVYLTQDAEDGFNNLVQLGFFSDGNVYCSVINGGTGSHRATASNSTEFVHACMTWDESQSSGSRTNLYLDGVLQSLSGTTEPSSLPSITNGFDIGRRASGPLQTDGQIELVHILDRVVPAQEAKNLYLDPFGPFRIARRPTFWGTLPAGGTIDLAGTTAGTSTVTGAMDITADLIGSTSGTSTVTGAMDITADLIGSTSGTSTVTGAMDVSTLVTFAGTTAGASTVTGAMDRTIALLGVAAATSTTAAVMDLTASLVATVAGTSTVAGAMSLTLDLSATVNALSTVVGALTVNVAGAITIPAEKHSISLTVSAYDIELANSV